MLSAWLRTLPVASRDRGRNAARGLAPKSAFQALDDRHVPIRTILVVDAVIILTWVAYRLLGRLRELILWIVIAAFIALVLNPIVGFLQRHRFRRSAAISVVFTAAVLVFLGLAFLFGYPLVNSLTHLSGRLPAMVHQVEKGHGSLARLLQHFHLLTWVQKNAPKLQQAAQNLSKPALGVGKAVVGTIVALTTIVSCRCSCSSRHPSFARSPWGRSRPIAEPRSKRWPTASRSR